MNYTIAISLAIFKMLIRLFFTLVLLLQLTINSYAQEVEMLPPPETIEQQVGVLQFAEKMPEFPGGQEMLLKYIQGNLKFPKICIENGIEGKVYVKFIVTQNGEIHQAKVVRGVKGCDQMDKEALSIVNSMPKWIPGMQGGKNVSVYYILPIQFKINQALEQKKP